MISKLYVIQDRVAEESGPIFESKNDAVAHRNFTKIIQTSTNPDDFKLIHVGEIDHDTNVITQLEIREVYIGLSMLDEEQENEANA